MTENCADLASGFYIIRHLLKHKFNLRIKELFESDQESASDILEKHRIPLEFLCRLRKRTGDETERMNKGFPENECAREGIQRGSLVNQRIL